MLSFSASTLKFSFSQSLCNSITALEISALHCLHGYWYCPCFLFYVKQQSIQGKDVMWTPLCNLYVDKKKKKMTVDGVFFLLTRITGTQLSHSNQTEGLKITIISLRGWKLKNADEQHPLKLRALLSSPLWRSLTTSHQLDFSFRGVFAARRTACSSLDEAMLTRPVSRRHKIHMLFSLKRMYGQT